MRDCWLSDVLGVRFSDSLGTSIYQLHENDRPEDLTFRLVCIKQWDYMKLNLGFNKRSTLFVWMMYLSKVVSTAEETCPSCKRVDMHRSRPEPPSHHHKSPLRVTGYLWTSVHVAPLDSDLVRSVMWEASTLISCSIIRKHFTYCWTYGQRSD